MCNVPSWVQTKDSVLFIVDKDIDEHDELCIANAGGHFAIRILWPSVKGTPYEGLSKKTPSQIVSALRSGRMNSILSGNPLLITDGKWNLPFVECHSILLEEGASLRVPNLTKIHDSIRLCGKASLNAPALVEIGGDLVVSRQSVFKAPNLEQIGCEITVYIGANISLPALTNADRVVAFNNAKLTARNVTEVRYINLHDGAAMLAPKLVRVDAVDLCDKSRLFAPKLKKVGGEALRKKNDTLIGPHWWPHDWLQWGALPQAESAGNHA